MDETLQVVCSIIEQDGKFLIAQRPKGKSLELKWEFPGGKIDANESETDALRREIREELGVEIEIAEKLSPCLHEYPDFTINLMPYRCFIRCGNIVAHEHLAMAWVDVNSAMDYDLTPADIPILKEYRLLSRREV